MKKQDNFIPQTFKLFGQTIKIEFDKNLLKNSDCYGVANYDANTITLQPLDKDINRTKAQLEQTFLHELFHFIFLRCGYSKLAQNEDLIEVVTHALQQYFETAEFLNEEKNES